MKLTPPLKYHGGKWYLAPKLVAMMPPHVHYVEPYAGGLSVLLAKDPEGVSEVVNDIDTRLMNFWGVLQNPILFAEFQRRMEVIPFSEAEWKAAKACENLAKERPIRPHLEAALFFVQCRQSLAGRMKDFATLSRTRVRRGMNEQASAWLTAVEGLPAVHARLKRVAILNRDAIDVIRQQDGPATLFYLDPPYLHETRASTDTYAHEMTEEGHRYLLHMLGGLEGKFLLSGYNSGLYASYARRFDWHRTDFDLPNNSAGGASKRRMTECVWTNFEV